MSYLFKLSSLSQDPLASTQNPLLHPPVLDTLFPYLAVNDLNNCRLVCSTWDTIGIPLIARRKLDPVRFSAIRSHEDFLALKSEFLNFPRKLQFFQGFRLGWADVSTMIWTNFLAPFKPKALLISGKLVTDPWTNFGQLLRPVATTLTHLELEIASRRRYSSCPPFTTLLYDLANLEGLTLKYLKMGKLHNRDRPDNLSDTQPDHKQALEKLFQGQSTTLEELHLDLIWSRPRPANTQLEAHQIHLPIFPCLHSLELNLQENWSRGLLIFAPFNFNLIFPNLRQLTTLDSLLIEMKNDALLLTRGHPLKKLEINWKYGFNEEEEYGIGDLLLALNSCFPCIEELKYTTRARSYFKLDVGNGIEILWVETLRILKVFGNGKDFDFRHLKELECLEYIVNEDYQNDQNNEFQVGPLVELLTDHFHQLPHLKSFHLSYKENIHMQEIINEIREGVQAEYRDFLTIDLHR